MPLLHVRILKHLDGDSSFAVGEIIAASGDLVHDLKIPIGDSAQPVGVELSPGNYLVRATLPSGNMVSQQVHIEHQPQTLNLEAHGSEHEWLSWHHFASGKAQKGRRPIELASFLGSTGDLLYEAKHERNASPTVSLLMIGSTGIVEHTPLVVGTDQNLTRGSLKFEVSTYLYDPYLLVRIRAEDPVHDPRSWPRVFVHVFLDEELQQLTAVPVPWPIADSIRTAPLNLFQAGSVEVLVSRPSAVSRMVSGSSPSKMIASTVIRDPVFGAVLAFLASGDPASAVKVTAELHVEARQFLYYKLENPFAAAAGGYVLLATYQGPTVPDGNDPEWFRWTENLMNWFPWLPDGAIIHGWMRLRRAKKDDLSVARECFVKAAGRGVPLFTEGLRLLIQGLSAVGGAKRNPKPVGAALAKVRPYAAAVDPSQPFSTFYGSNPDSPMVPPASKMSRKGGPAALTSTVRELSTARR